MKLISLNIWDARVFEPLMQFFSENQDIDIFCLQEVFNGDKVGFFRGDRRVNGFNEIAARLPNHTGYFVSTENLDDIPEQGLAYPYGLAIFIKKDIPVLSHKHSIVFGEKNVFVNSNARSHKRVVQTICIKHNKKTFAISNFHGLWNGKGKTDTPERIEQSQKVRSHVDAFPHATILVGDFNLLPETESLKIASAGLRDLIAEKNITSTRSKLYTKHEKPVLFADYAFTSPNVQVNHFSVLQDVVSDHLPLLLDFE